MPRLSTALVAALTGAGMAQAGCTFSWKAAKGDTCESMAGDWGISTSDFIKWNPSVGADCKNGVVAGNDYCVEYSGDSGPDPVTTTTTTTTPTSKDTPPATTTTSTGPSKPSPTQPGLIDSCTTYYKTKTGDYCQAIVDKYGTFSLEDFVKWNPAVKDDCSGLFADYYYCVGIPGTPTNRPPTTTTTKVPTGPSPTQPGLVSNCQKFYKTKTGDYCEAIVNKYGTFSLKDFVKWNPAVKDDCSGLFADYYYCVGVPGTPDKPTTTQPSGPSPTQSGIAKNCKEFYKVQSGDYCDKIIDKYNKRFDLKQFVSWNPAVKSDCTGLWVNYYVCVRV